MVTGQIDACIRLKDISQCRKQPFPKKIRKWESGKGRNICSVKVSCRHRVLFIERGWQKHIRYLLKSGFTLTYAYFWQNFVTESDYPEQFFTLFRFLLIFVSTDIVLPAYLYHVTNLSFTMLHLLITFAAFKRLFLVLNVSTTID